MFLKAGAVSLALLLASRLLGLARESALAAAFGTSGLADAAMLVLTLPDLVAGLFAAGALSYALLPHWAALSPGAIAATQRRVARLLVAAGLLLAVGLALGREPVLRLLATGLGEASRPQALRGLLWAAAALPAALLASLWVTRLQHERDVVGMYSANLVVNGVLILAMGGIALAHPAQAMPVLGLGLLAGVGLRLAWLARRMRRVPACVPAPEAGLRELPAPALWVWAALASGLPLALPFAARSIASAQGEGALATFGYAWKLVELPLGLAIQLVAALALPAISRAISNAADTRAAVRAALALAWVLACAATAALVVGAPAIASLLFGWGRMSGAAVAEVAAWGRVGAWGLPAQAVIAVALAALAAQRRMKPVALLYALGLLALVAATPWKPAGPVLMGMLNAILALVAVAALAVSGAFASGWLPWRALGGAGAALLLAAAAAAVLPSAGSGLAGLLAGGLAATAVLAAAWGWSPEFRGALRR